MFQLDTNTNLLTKKFIYFVVYFSAKYFIEEAVEWVWCRQWEEEVSAEVEEGEERQEEAGGQHQPGQVPEPAVKGGDMLG